jgi:hypothetical protein
MFIKKNDTLLGPIQSIMDRSDATRKAMAEVNTEFGVSSRRGLTLEKKAEYDIALKAKLSGEKPVLTEGKIEEASKAKLAAYVDAATHDAARNAAKTELALIKGKKDDAVRYKKIQLKRMKNSALGVSKIAGLPSSKVHAKEEEQIDEAMKPSTIMSKYASNEDQNFKRDNDVMLAKHFGTPEEHKNAVEFRKAHQKQGSLPMNHPLKAKVDAAADKHYKSLLQAVSQEKDAGRAALKPTSPGNRESELKSRVAKVGAVAKFVKKSVKDGNSYPNQTRAWQPVKSTTHSDGVVDKSMKGTSDETLDRAKKITSKIKGEIKNLKKQPTLPLKESHEYSKSAVDKEIKKDKRIKGKEGKMIHAILKGRQKHDEPQIKKIKEEIAENLFKKYEAVCENEITLHAFLRDLSEEQIALLEGRAGGVVARPPATAVAPVAPPVVPGHAPMPQPSVGPGRSAAPSPTASPLFNPQPATAGRAAAPAARPVGGATPATAQTAGAASVAPVTPTPPAPAVTSPTVASNPDAERGTTAPGIQPAATTTTPATAPAKPTLAVSKPKPKTMATQKSAQRPATRKPMLPNRKFGYGAGGSGANDAGSITNRALGGVNEEIKYVDPTPIVIKPSLDKFLRNKYLK